MEPQDRHAAGQGVSQLRQQQDIGRSGQHKSSGLAVPVDGHLQCGKELGHVLHFVEDHAARQVGHKADRVGGRDFARHGIIESQVGVALAPAG
jgi:hypothetical protein